jgi:hypothetical protein
VKAIEDSKIDETAIKENVKALESNRKRELEFKSEIKSKFRFKNRN